MKGIAIAREIGVKETTFRKHYVPLLEQRGVRNDKDGDGSLAAAARSLPTRRGGKWSHVGCLYRWTVSGCKGVILESLQCGGRRVTSKEALERFMKVLTYGIDRSAVRSPLKRGRGGRQSGKPPARAASPAGLDIFAFCENT